jgi:hypothetical protein
MEERHDEHCDRLLQVQQSACLWMVQDVFWSADVLLDHCRAVVVGEDLAAVGDRDGVDVDEDHA